MSRERNKKARKARNQEKAEALLLRVQQQDHTRSDNAGRFTGLFRGGQKLMLEGSGVRVDMLEGSPEDPNHLLKERTALEQMEVSQETRQ